MAGGDPLQHVSEQAYGSTPFILQVSISVAARAHETAPSSWPANNAFFFVSFSGRIRFSTKFVSISTRPSCRNTSNPSQCLAK